MADDALLNVGQKAYINKNNNLLILSDEVYGFDLPGGKVQVGEINFPEALKREVREETGLEIEVIEPFNTWYFEWPLGHRNAGKKAVVIDYRCEYISGEIVLSDEHEKDIKWVHANNWRDYFQEDNIYFISLKRYFSE